MDRVFQGRGTRAVFQFYPETVSQTELITTQATKAGFTGGVVIDFPNSTKAKKYFYAKCFFLLKSNVLKYSNESACCFHYCLLLILSILNNIFKEFIWCWWLVVYNSCQNH